MKILAIRGQNLASLYGPFEVDLEAPPIAGAGLFSISGPTGAGKSTLLDALCLALFGRTPRLDGRGGVRIGRDGEAAGERVAARDVRTLLSRGTAHGHAEVLFRGVDGVRYRARWQVRRARDRAGGRLQDQEMMLWAEGNPRPIGEGLQGTRAEIVKRLGFGFEEFRRAVVLPQFEFTAFLRASEAERAAILQRVTGTDFYETLSRAAHERAAAEKRAQEEVEVRAGLTAPLDPEARRALEGELERAEAARARAAEALARAGQVLAWYARAEELDLGVAEAERAFSEAEAELARAAPLERELEELERALAHRAEFAAAASAEGALAAALAERARCEDEAARKGGALEGSREKAARAAALLDDATAAREKLAPEIARARALDAELEAARARAELARREAEAAGAALAESRAEEEGAQGAEAAARAEERGARAWLAAHAEVAPLAEGLEGVLRDLAEHEGLGRDRARAALRLGAAEEELRAAAGSRAERARSLAVARAAAEEAEAELARAEAARGRAEPAVLAAEAAALEAAVQTLLELAGEAARAEEAGRAHERERARAARAEEALRALGDRARGEEALKLGAERALAEARHALGRALEARSVEEHRKNLIAGEPCPLCGALEHPWAGGAPLSDAFAARVESLEAEVEERRDEVAALRREEAVRRREAALAREAGEAAGRSLLLAEARYREALPAAGVPLPERGRDARAAAEGALEGGRARARAARDAAAAAATLERAAWGARITCEERRRDLAAREEEARAAEADAMAKERAKGEALQALQGLERERERLEERLAPTFSGWSGWREALREAATAFASRAREAASEFRSRRAAEEHGRAEAARAAEAAALARGRALEREAAFARAAQALARAEGEEREALARRAGVLGGRGASAIEEELARGSRCAAAESELARAELSRAQVEEAASAAAYALAERALLDRRAEAGRAGAALAAVLAALGFDRARLGALLERGEALAQARRAELSALGKRAEGARGGLEERRRARGAHAREGRPELSREAAAEERAAAVPALGSAEEALLDARLKVKDDDDRRARLLALGPRRAELERRVRAWTALASVIGSADGSKLGVFAQGLTLDALVAAANAQLGELSPRYRLLRVPGEDLDLQVLDLDLGGEVRSVDSLSGGESFLVSLALALGLATLASRTPTVETLFVDEGFGTLDRDTLEHALVALEALQARGRTVGIISHVPELEERLGARVRVEPVGTGRSRVVTLARA